MMRLVLLVLIALPSVGAAPPSTRPTTVPSISRTPQWPLKERRTLFTDAAVDQARANVSKYPSAKAVAESWIRLADEWVTWDDQALMDLIPSAAVPRDWGVSSDPNCPECGKPIGDPNNKPGWIVDAKRPFKVQCPLCSSVFPTNDFDAYYRSSFKEKVGWDTKYVDDGWGWTDPKTGEKYWFVAFANHWVVHGKLMNVMHALGRAHLITGDERYAHKALVLLHRFAEVYPEMDYGAQSRYGALMRAQGKDYPGKVVNHIWETDFVTALTEAYDACWDTIDRDAQLQRTTGKTGQEIRAFIEANLLEDAIDAYFQGKIRGNFGMHQSALAHLGIVRQHGEQEKWFDLLMNESSPSYPLLGLNFALHNVVFRDGFSLETSSHYNSLWVRKISEYASILQKTGRKPFEIPKLRRIYDAVLAMIVTRAHNPSIGDGGSVWGGIFQLDPASFQTAYRQYRDPRYLRYLFAMYGPPKDGGFTTFESLFHPPIVGEDSPTTMPTTHPAQPSRLLDGYGMGFLNNKADSVGVALYYGLIAGHGHFDRLHFELFASGHPMMPDLGYPDAMNDFVPGIYTWSKNTVAHNTVVVDASRQTENVPGTVEMFADGSFARVIDVSTKGTYPQCERYRRAMIMFDCGEDQAYFIDVFSVTGGKQHDYSLHGPPGTFEAIGGQWAAQPRGTLAGEDVEVGQIYDNPKMAAADYKGGYSGYTGSGFQHFTNIRRHTGGETIAQWSHAKDPSAKLRIRVLDQPGQQLILASARVSPVKHPEELTYLIARRQGEGLDSRFVSVIEPFRDEPLLESVRALPSERAGEVALEVRRRDGSTDTITYDPQGRVNVRRRDAAGRAAGRFAVARGTSAQTGSVVGVEAQRSEVRIRASAPVEPHVFVGRVVHFENDLRRTAHPIVAARRDGDEIVLTTGDDLLVGRARIEAVGDNVLTTKTALPLAAIYRGVTLGNADFEPVARVESVEKGKVTLAAPVSTESRPAGGDDVWLINVGPGDTFELPSVIDEAR